MELDSVAPPVVAAHRSKYVAARDVGMYVALFVAVGTIFAVVPFAFHDAVQMTTNETMLYQNTTNDTSDDVTPTPVSPPPPLPTLPLPNRTFVVFMGDSVTLGWRNFTLPYGNPLYINRGWPGSTTIHMKTRFVNDVLKHQPAIVVIMGGLNDLGGADGYYPTNEDIVGHLAWMANRAVADGSRALLCSITPMLRYGDEVGVPPPAPRIVAVNHLLNSFANKTYGVEYVDYWSSLHGEDGGLLPEYTLDGVHLTPEGYSVMESILAPLL